MFFREAQFFNWVDLRDDFLATEGSLTLYTISVDDPICKHVAYV